MISTLATDLPNMMSTIQSWARLTKVFVVAKRQVNFQTVESLYMKETLLFRCPTGQKLEMKWEGQRKWNTETIYTDTTIDLKVDDVIMIGCDKSEKYRIMNKTDWSPYGFQQFEIMSDYRK